jgi:hypothetical protein
MNNVGRVIPLLVGFLGFGLRVGRMVERNMFETFAARLLPAKGCLWVPGSTSS